MDLLYILYDNRYWSKILFGITPTPAYDLKVKVMEFLFGTIPIPAYDIGQGHGLKNFMFKFASKFFQFFFM